MSRNDLFQVRRFAIRIVFVSHISNALELGRFYQCGWLCSIVVGSFRS